MNPLRFKVRAKYRGEEFDTEVTLIHPSPDLIQLIPQVEAAVKNDLRLTGKRLDLISVIPIPS